MSEEWTENGVQHLIVYSYDASGSPISMTYRKSTDAATAAEVYFLASNPQGDITYIYDIDGNRVVTYNYDAWGNILSISGTKASTIGRYNPFRYRGYYFDNETGFYYLQSRYYNPTWGRFISADGQLNDDLLGYNQFAYAENNPVMLIDPTGCAPKWWQTILIGVAVIAVVAVVTAAVVTTGGGAAAVLATTGKLVLTGLKIAATAGLAAGTVRAGKSICEGETDISEVGKDFVTGFADGFLAGSFYTGGAMVGSVISYTISGAFNKGYGWGSGTWEGGYQTPKTSGISIATHLGGVNGGRSFGLDLDVYNGLHYHTNKFGIGPKSNWIKAHHWADVPILIGLGVGLSDGWSEW